MSEKVSILILVKDGMKTIQEATAATRFYSRGEELSLTPGKKNLKKRWGGYIAKSRMGISG